MVSAASTVSVVNAGGIPIYLVWSSSILVLTAVACPHLETVFHDETHRYGLLLNAAIEIAVALAGCEAIKVDNSYFRRKASEMQPTTRRINTMWSLGPRDSRVMLICRMRNWEKMNERLISLEEIPRPIVQAYAEKLGIYDHFEDSMTALLQGRRGLVEAILASYTQSSQNICAKGKFNNLVKANEAQKAGGYQASLKARNNRMAEADARKIALGLNPIQRKALACPTCSRCLLSRQGLHEHIRVEHEGFRYCCTVTGCGKEFKGRSGLRDYWKQKHRTKDLERQYETSQIR